ncbi:hypothetical protein Tco_0037931 [Tanacetum coccineum]
MSDLKFADTHNLVAFLEITTESEGFEEIVDFLNANPIKNALTVNASPLTYFITSSSSFLISPSSLILSITIPSTYTHGKEAVYEERDDSLERATTTATGLDAEQDKGNISKTQSKATPNEPSSIGTSLGGGPRRQRHLTLRDTIAQD